MVLFRSLVRCIS